MRVVTVLVGVAAVVCGIYKAGEQGSDTSIASPDAVRDFLLSHLGIGNETQGAAGVDSPRTVGLAVQDQAARLRRPIVILPGITSCGLEVWRAKRCLGDGFFRTRLWGGLSMVDAIVRGFECWLAHIEALDPVTGGDVDGDDAPRLRSARGHHASDDFVQGFWVWSKMLTALGAAGYEPDEVLLECYDWRLALPVLEERDYFFTQLKHNIEVAVHVAGQRRGQESAKAIVLAHSMGGSVLLYFLKFMEAQPGGTQWISDHIDSIVCLGVPFLGAMAPLAAYISGEMKDSGGVMRGLSVFGPLQGYVETALLSFERVRSILWRFGSMGSLLPKGGSAVWGDESGWTDFAGGHVVQVPRTRGNATQSGGGLVGVSLEEIYSEVGNRPPHHNEVPPKAHRSWTAYDRGLHKPTSGTSRNDTFWGNPLAVSLPASPSLKMFCFYGTNISTERAYAYAFRQARWEFADGNGTGQLWSQLRTKPLRLIIQELEYAGARPETSERPVRLDVSSALPQKVWASPGSAADALRALEPAVQPDGNHEGDKDGALKRAPPSRLSPEDWIRIDQAYGDRGFENGIATTEGDGTVPLVSLSYVCGHAWRARESEKIAALFNPGGIETVVREYPHRPGASVNTASFGQKLFAAPDLRGGPLAATHVEIIGNTEVLQDVLQIAVRRDGPGAHTDSLPAERVHSDMLEIGRRVSAKIERQLGL